MCRSNKILSKALVGDATEMKLSEIILEMIEPYKDMDRENLEKIMLSAISVWNMTIVPYTMKYG